jgi:hypothetical protein
VRIRQHFSPAIDLEEKQGRPIGPPEGKDRVRGMRDLRTRLRGVRDDVAE